MGPSSGLEAKPAGVAPALTHVDVDGRYLSLLGAFLTSRVNTLPSGRIVQSSSELMPSIFPVGLITVQVRVDGSSRASCWFSLLPSRSCPFGNTAVGASPI